MDLDDGLCVGYGFTDRHDYQAVYEIIVRLGGADDALSGPMF